MPNRNHLSSLDEPRVRALEHYGPVTALRIIGDHVVAGYGPVLKVFDASTLTLTASHQFFARNKIHHIGFHSGQLVVSGGRSFAVVPLNDIGSARERAIHEWITAAEFLDAHTVLILTSHNVVYKVQTSTFDVVEKIHCGEKSLLYSGSIHVSPANVLVAAGTVMSGVLVWDLATRQIVHELQDHEGSIFGVKINSSATRLVSCSDDRSVKLYDFASGKVLGTGWGHGSRIWNLAFLDDNTIFSTGEDCTARLWEYTDDLRQVQLWDNTHSGKHIWSGDVSKGQGIAVTGGADGKIRVHQLTKNQSHMHLLDLHKKEVIKDFCYHQGDLVVLTSEGRVFRKASEWVEVVADPALCLGLMSEVGDAVLVCCRNGDVLRIGEELSWTRASTTKVTNFLVDGTFALVDCPNPKVPLALHTASGVKVLQHPGFQFPTTSFHVDKTNNWAIVGSRHACLAVYDLSSNTSAYFRKICPGDTFTSIAPVESKKNTIVLLVTIRDGYYIYLEVTKNPEFSYKIIHQNKLTRGFVEGGYIHDNELIVYGFKSLYFYVWNESRQVELASEMCGGAHRKWKYLNGRLLYMQRDSLVEATFPEPLREYGILNSGTHGREIRDVAMSPALRADGLRLLMSASEDSTIRVSTLEENGSVRSFWSLNSHVSGLQSVKFLSEEYAASSAANEEFLVWRLGTLSNGIPTAIEAARLPSANASLDLRIMDFCSVPSPDGFLICTVYSDSHIRLIYFNSTTATFTELASTFYSTCCILNANFVQIEEKNLLIIGTTDGCLSVYDVTENSLDNMLVKQQLHQSGIKAVATVKRTDSYYIITGGDDNALTFNELTSAGLKPLDFVEVAASATITSILPTATGFITTSVDQIVRLWTYTPTLSCVSARYTTVADTGCSDTTTFGNNICVVGGAGLSTFSIE